MIGRAAMERTVKGNRPGSSGSGYSTCGALVQISKTVDRVGMLSCRCCVEVVASLGAEGMEKGHSIGARLRPDTAHDALGCVLLDDLRVDADARAVAAKYPIEGDASGRCGSVDRASDSLILVAQ